MPLSIHALADATGLSQRTLQSYVRLGIVSRPALRGSATTYGDDDRLRVLAARRLKREKHLRLGAIARLLAQTPPADLPRLAGVAPAAPPAPAAQAPALAAGAPLGPYRPAAGRALCEHIALCPGVELVVRADADPEALRVVREIEAAYRRPLVGA
jgi:DNA-binding transcriptional MerR regulator